MVPSWSGTMRVMKLRKVAIILLAVVGLILVAVTIHVAGVIYYYSDYFVLLLPEPPLPVMRQPQETVALQKIVGGAEGTDGKPDLPRILCLIVTSPSYHATRASHVAVTWARHCTKSVFLTTRRDVRLPNTVLTAGASSYRQLWGKVKQGFEWAYKHRGDYDWVFKADDDTFAMIENLQAALAPLDPNRPQATGNHLNNWDINARYLNGGAGYVLSRGAVTKLVEEGIRTKACDRNLPLGTSEDVNMADCLTYLGVEFLDSRDSLQRQRFNVYPPQELIDPRQANTITHLWLKKTSAFPYKFGYPELSSEVISFHYVDAQTMYLLYYLIYIVNPANADQISSFRSVDQQTNAVKSRTMR